MEIFVPIIFGFLIFLTLIASKEISNFKSPTETNFDNLHDNDRFFITGKQIKEIGKKIKSLEAEIQEDRQKYFKIKCENWKEICLDYAEMDKKVKLLEETFKIKE